MDAQTSDVQLGQMFVAEGELEAEAVSVAGLVTVSSRGLEAVKKLGCLCFGMWQSVIADCLWWCVTLLYAGLALGPLSEI